MIIYSRDKILRLAVAEQLHITTDSRTAVPGCIFVALPAPQREHSGVRDGSEFIVQAAEAGAGYIVCTHETACRLLSGRKLGTEGPMPRLVPVEHPHEFLGEVAAARYGTESTPESPMDVFAVTGTNGKTTVTYLLEHLFTAAGKPTGVLGTVAYRWPGHSEPAPLTTPGALEIHERISRMKAAGAEACVLEASSHALDQRRLSGLRFRGAIFTNLTQDHLDYHGDMEDYFASKARLFFTLPDFDKALAINADDMYGRRLLGALPHAVGFGLLDIPAGIASHRFLHGKVLSHAADGLHLRMTYGAQSWELKSPLVGLFNASNLLAAQAMALAAGFPPERLQALASFTGVPGRMERVDNARGLHVFVDYAHTPDALVNVLSSVRGAGFKRVVTVFGCGGDRDRTKRPLMGKAVAEYADVAVLTSDNPRTEDPLEIMADVLPGLADAKAVIQESDRRAAIRLALEQLGPDDALIVAGKGHEDYQIIGREKRHFSDQETIRELLA